MATITETLTQAEQNMLKVYCATRYIKQILNVYDMEFLKLACNSFYLEKTTSELFDRMTTLVKEKETIIKIYNIIEEALKDLYLDDFLLLEWQYIKLLNMNDIINRLKVSPRTYYRMLKDARNSFFSRVKYYDTQELVINYEKHITNKFIKKKLESFRGNGEAANHKKF